ncbi:hypothetical protein [Bradyrhizobium sp. USDA 3458]|uniref:hypothetical protein n=1 Tax=Bradyrhizobium sp. USDA 3458 TaxID=2591461 RepID=UPI001141AC3F|nr:hypothetical protein [Bradyrhizobium sp. USDA 3458]
MSERGVFAVDRGIWDHPMFPDEPFTEREAWQWLIGEASFKPRTRNIGGKVIPLDRGQLAASIRFMAERWTWSKSKVERFLKRLKTETMIETASGTGLLVITICNYDKYQRVSLPDRDEEQDSNRDARGTATGQQRDKREDTENTEYTEHTPPRAKRARASVGRFDEFWSEYPRRGGSNPRKAALGVYQQAVKSGADEQAIIDGAKRYRADLRKQQQEGSKYVAQAVTWLRQCRWEDDLPTASAATPNFATGDPPVDWRKWMRGYMVLPSYSRSWYGPGGEPGREGCEVPCDILREFGFEPVPWVRRSDGRQFGIEENGDHDERPRQAAG